MADWSQIQAIIGPANQAISQTLQYVQSIQANPPQQTMSGTSTYPYGTTSYGGTTSVDPNTQAYMQEMETQNQQMSMMMQTMMGIMSSLMTSGAIDFTKTNLSQDQINQMISSMQSFSGGMSSGMNMSTMPTTYPSYAQQMASTVAMSPNSMYQQLYNYNTNAMNEGSYGGLSTSQDPLQA